MTSTLAGFEATSIRQPRRRLLASACVFAVLGLVLVASPAFSQEASVELCIASIERAPALGLRRVFLRGAPPNDPGSWSEDTLCVTLSVPPEEPTVVEVCSVFGKMKVSFGDDVRPGQPSVETTNSIWKDCQPITVPWEPGARTYLSVTVTEMYIPPVVDGVLVSSTIAGFERECLTGKARGCLEAMKLLDTPLTQERRAFYSKRARTLFEKECDKRHPDACVEAAALQETTKKAASYWKRACEGGSEEGCKQLPAQKTAP